MTQPVTKYFVVMCFIAIIKIKLMFSLLTIDRKRTLNGNRIFIKKLQSNASAIFKVAKVPHTAESIIF